MNYSFRTGLYYNTTLRYILKNMYACVHVDIYTYCFKFSFFLSA
jgi:hypothetical protein